MRVLPWALALWLGGCPEDHGPVPSDAGRDALPPADSGPDARVCGPGDLVLSSFEHCLGCGSPCDAVRPYCCVGTCCRDECGASPNDCAPTAPSLPDAGPAPDAGCIDPGLSHDHCLGCGVPCGERRPFCCGETCCEEECGTIDNRCSALP